MTPVSLLLNVLWIVLGGAWMAFGWLVAAIIMAITIIGLPWARAAFNIAAYTLFPFGSRAVSRGLYTGQQDIGTGPLGVTRTKTHGSIAALPLARHPAASQRRYESPPHSPSLVGNEPERNPRRVWRDVARRQGAMGARAARTQ